MKRSNETPGIEQRLLANAHRRFRIALNHEEQEDGQVSGSGFADSVHCRSPGLVGLRVFFCPGPLSRPGGGPVSDVRYPQLHYQKRIGDDASGAVIEYSIDALWRCRWRFEVEKESSVVRAWTYPDAEAAKWCRTLPSSRP